MKKNKYLFFLFSINLSIILFLFVLVNNVFASPAISSFLLNGNAQNVTFNPDNGESVSIEVKANTQVKFTRLYICSVDQLCNGTSGNYTRYFTQSDISDTITKSWNGKKSGDVDIVPSGEYKVMVSMTEGTNSPVTEFGQYSIFVDFSSVASTTTDPTSSDDTNEDATSTTKDSSTSTSTSNVSVVTRIVYVSAHSGTEDLSNFDDKTAFEITAGRERMALIGSPIEYDAKYNLLQKDQCVPTFKWSFGDGFDAIGKNIAHTYKYPGEYQVVLNGNCGEYNSTSRTIVKVVYPNISILGRSNGDIEITNNNKSEINIGNWKVKGGRKDFIFPQDTIISANNKIVLSKEDLGADLLIDRISLDNPSGGEVAYIDIKNGQQTTASFSQAEIIQDSMLASSSNISVTEAENLVREYKEKLAVNEQQTNNAETIVKSDLTNVSDNSSSSDEGSLQVASVAESINSSSTKSFWTQLIDIPVRSIKSFAHVFYDF